MHESDPALQAVYDLRDAGLSRPAPETLRARVQAAVQKEIDAETLGSGRPRVRARRRGRRLSGGDLVAAIGVIVAITVAVAALALLSHGRGQSLTPAVGPDQLIARLAVLRRPQTAADVLPAELHIVNADHHHGTIIPGLTRLVATPPGARLFLVVQNPTGGSLPTWSPTLGPQVAIVEITAGHATQTEPIPAADLTNADEVRPVGIQTTRQSHGRFQASYDVAIIPDGVAHVRWTFLGGDAKPGRVVRITPTNNLAAVAFDRSTGLLLHGSWYGPNGHVIPTSDRAVLRADAHRTDVLRARIIRYDLAHEHHAPQALLARFAVFAITSQTGVRTASGNIILHPALASIPYPILQGAASPDLLPYPDPEEIREVITPSGARVFVIPGQRGLCLAHLDTSPLPDGLFSGTGSSCTATLAQAEAGGVAFGSSHLGSPPTTYRIVPRSQPTITVRSRDGKQTAISVPDGIYVGQTPSVH